jgi:hypothetical protein
LKTIFLNLCTKQHFEEKNEMTITCVCPSIMEYETFDVAYIFGVIFADIADGLSYLKF